MAISFSMLKGNVQRGNMVHSKSLGEGDICLLTFRLKKCLSCLQLLLWPPDHEGDEWNTELLVHDQTWRPNSDRFGGLQGRLGSAGASLNYLCSSVLGKDQCQQNKSGFRLVAFLFLSCLITVKHFSKCSKEM